MLIDCFKGGSSLQTWTATSVGECSWSAGFGCSNGLSSSSRPLWREHSTKSRYFFRLDLPSFGAAPGCSADVPIRILPASAAWGHCGTGPNGPSDHMHWIRTFPRVSSCGTQIHSTMVSPVGPICEYRCSYAQGREQERKIKCWWGLRKVSG